MRKEIIYAIIAGGFLGIAIAFGVWRVNATLSPNKNSQSPGTKPSQEENSLVTIAKPSNNDVISQNPLAITGIAKPGSVLLISSDSKDYLPNLDNKGSFSIDIDLPAGGINQLVIASFDDKGNLTKQVLTLVFSTEFSKVTPPTPTPTEKGAQQSTDSVRKKVEEKVAAALNSPTSYFGTVTDIAESSIQLKSAAGEIEQLSTAAGPTVIKDGKTPKEVKLTDIAIGDFIVAMGFTGDNHSLEARRILITKPPTSPAYDYVYGTVTKNTKGQVSLTTKAGQALTLVTTDKTLVYLKDQGQLSKIKSANLSESDVLVGVGNFSGATFKARTVFVTERP